MKLLDLQETLDKLKSHFNEVDPKSIEITGPDFFEEVHAMVGKHDIEKAKVLTTAAAYANASEKQIIQNLVTKKFDEQYVDITFTFKDNTYLRLDYELKSDGSIRCRSSFTNSEPRMSAPVPAGAGKRITSVEQAFIYCMKNLKHLQKIELMKIEHEKELKELLKKKKPAK